MTMKLNQNYVLGTFVVDSANELAYNAAKVVVSEQQSPFNPLFIHGGYGVGKTHLLQGICNAVCRRRPQTNWLYLSAEDFANQFVLALKTKKLEAFRRRMRQTDLLAIDDIQFLASKPSTQEEFLHTFNTISLAGKQVVLVSDAHPKMIGQLSEKLINRFVSGMVVEINPPSFEGRKEICRQYIRNMKKHIPESVIEYVADRIHNIRALQSALFRLQASTSSLDENILLEHARNILSGEVENHHRSIGIKDIVQVVTSHFDISLDDLLSNEHREDRDTPREICMYLALKLTHHSLEEIEGSLGWRDHTTVMDACYKIDKAKERYPELNALINKLIDEVLVSPDEHEGTSDRITGLKLRVCLSEFAQADEVATELILLCQDLNAYDIACGGKGFVIDDWQMFVREPEFVEVL